MNRRAARILTASLVLTDATMAALAFALGYALRLQSEYAEIAPFDRYLGMMLLHVAVVVCVFAFYRLYQRKRATSHLDELYSIFAAVSVATVIAIAL
ncbi:MAG: hypothetical protein NZ765_08780, partial [Anaerolineae bacterium]|nr:hypothetical protein [Anaerolineae bacterium]MDW8071621.1 hypothetical protein [Anaerolineae bacterium]